MSGMDFDSFSPEYSLIVCWPARISTRRAQATSAPVSGVSAVEWRMLAAIAGFAVRSFMSRNSQTRFSSWSSSSLTEIQPVSSNFPDGGQVIQVPATRDCLVSGFFLARQGKAVAGFKVHPEFGRCAKGFGKFQGGFRADPFVTDDCRWPGRDAQRYPTDHAGPAARLEVPFL